jgi:hypothetical protein
MDFLRWLIGSIFTETVTLWARRSQEAHANRRKPADRRQLLCKPAGSRRWQGQW